MFSLHYFRRCLLFFVAELRWCQKIFHGSIGRWATQVPSLHLYRHFQAQISQLLFFKPTLSTSQYEKSSWRQRTATGDLFAFVFFQSKANYNFSKNLKNIIYRQLYRGKSRCQGMIGSAKLYQDAVNACMLLPVFLQIIFQTFISSLCSDISNPLDY